MASGGAVDGFDAFVVARHAALIRVARLLTGDAGSAEDLVQTALLKVFLHWDTVSRADNPDAYLQRMLVNTHVSEQRR